MSGFLKAVVCNARRDAHFGVFIMIHSRHRFKRLCERRESPELMETIHQLLADTVQHHDQLLALKMRSGLHLERLTYSELYSQAQALASFLHARGLKKGDRVILWAPNSPNWVVAYLGSLIAGGVVVPLDRGSTPAFVRDVSSQTDPLTAFVSKSIPAGVEALPVATIQLEELPYLLSDHPEAFLASQVEGQDLAEIVFTSGTTGEPKGVMLTHRNVIRNVEMTQQMVKLEAEATILSLLPLSHMLEQIVGLWIPLCSGAKIVYLPSRQPHILTRTLREEKITAMILVPQALQILMNHIEHEVEGRGLMPFWRFLQILASHLPNRVRRLLFWPVHRQLGGGLTFFACGGAYLDPTTARPWEAMGVPILQGYGATEATAVVTGNSLDRRRSGTVGWVPSSEQLRLADDGEILIKGENVSQGYWRNQRATKQVFSEGWYRTGDLGSMDADGYLHFKGRKKNLIVLSDGMKVYPEDIENRLNIRPEIQEGVVIGLPQKDGRVEVHAVVLASEPASVEKTIRETNLLLAPHQQIRGFTLWPGDDFPRTHTLKVKRHDVLKALSEAATPDKLRPVATTRKAAVDLLDVVAEISAVERGQIRPQSSLGLDLGLDSLSIAELLCLIEETLGVYVDEGRLPPQATVGDLEAILIDSGELAAPAEFPLWPLGLPARAARTVLQKVILNPLLTVFCPTLVRGLENLGERSGPFLFAANHSSHLDTPVVLKVLHRKYGGRLSVAAAADYWFAHPWTGFPAFLLFNAFPMARRGNARPSMEHAVSLIDRGWSVLIFPEGTRSTSGEMLSFKAGVGLLAVELGVPVVPLYLRGLHAVLPKGSVIPRRMHVEVRIGLPMKFPPWTDHHQAAQQVEEAFHRLSNYEAERQSPPEA